MEQKYQIKNQEKSADGTENSEHIFDMIERAEMCINNIQDNTDLCMNIFKLKKEDCDEDEADALQLLCEDSIAIEQETIGICDEVEIVKNKIKKHIKIGENSVEEILKRVLILELKSKNIVEKILNNK